MSARKVLFLAPAQAVTRIFAALKTMDVEVGIAENMRGASAFIRQSSPALIITRPSLPGYKAEDLLAVGVEDPSFPAVIVTSEHGTTQDAEHYLSLGAKDYWLEPLSPEKIVASLPAFVKSAPVPPNTTLGGHKPDLTGARIIGQDPAIARILTLAKQVAPSKATVLIAGESGTGKEVFARYVHNMSGRGGRPFVAINCAALPEHLLESELFGHEKGAFTGANARSAGRFEQAEGGTLFLDEIGDMPMEAQTRLLRVLQQGEYTTVGGRTPIKADVRIVTATNKDLRALIQQGLFREDLYFRLNVVPLRLPPLRERAEDIPDLIRHFFKLAEREGLPGKQIETAAVERLKRYRWPGNIRELENLARRLAALYPQETITTAVIDNELAPPASAPAGAEDARPEENLSAAVERYLNRYFGAFGDGLPPPGLYHRILREIEYPLLSVALAATRGNQIRAADLLGVNRNTLRKKIRDLEIQVIRTSG
jgi:two-component system nitrogen regulation response regulator GlnG